MGVEHAIAHAVAFAAIARIFQQPQPGSPGSESLHLLCGVIARAVVNDNYFRIPSAFGNVRQHTLQRGLYAGALVVCGDNDAVGAVVRREPSVVSRLWFLWHAPVVSR